MKRDQDSSGYSKFPFQFLSGLTQQKIIYSVDFPSNTNHNKKFLFSKSVTLLNSLKQRKIKEIYVQGETLIQQNKS